MKLNADQLINSIKAATSSPASGAGNPQAAPTLIPAQQPRNVAPSAPQPAQGAPVPPVLQPRLGPVEYHPAVGLHMKVL